MAGVRKTPLKSGNFQGYYQSWRGKQTFFTGTSSRSDTLDMARHFESEHKQMRLGYRPVPTNADEHSQRPFEEVAKEYQEWGESQGGRGGRPWGPTHARNRRSHLKRWQEDLGLATLREFGVGIRRKRQRGPDTCPARNT